MRLTKRDVGPTSIWLVAVLLVASASASFNIWYLSILVTVTLAGLAIWAVRTKRPAAFWLSLWLAFTAVAARVLFGIVFSGTEPGIELNLGFGPPLHLLGQISAGQMESFAILGLRVSAIVSVVGLANAMANPRALLRSAPSVLRNFSTALAMALNLGPQVAVSAQRIRAARSLRSASRASLRLGSLMVAVLQDAIEKSMQLAASMELRGFGAGKSSSADQHPRISAPLIAARNLSLTAASGQPILEDISIAVNAGEVLLISGPTGCGKSSLLKSLAGITPKYTGGRLTGDVLIQGSIGYVGQVAEATFVGEKVADEIAFVLEQTGVGRNELRSRVEAIAERFDLGELLDQPVMNLSGGQQQRLAIAAAAVTEPEILLLDEPTSELDEQGARMVVELVQHLASLGTAVLVAEHKAERFEVVAHRRFEFPPHQVSRHSVASATRTSAATNRVLEVSGLNVPRGSRLVLEDFDLEVRAGEIVALVGPNGCGKSTALWAIAGELKRTDGLVSISGEDPAVAKRLRRPQLVSLVPQNAQDLLFHQSVAIELADLAENEDAPTDISKTLHRLIGEVAPETHPSDLSSGQQLGLALAMQLASSAPLVLLDEPTRGLDQSARETLGLILSELREQGRGILLASHDRDFVAGWTDRQVRLD